MRARCLLLFCLVTLAANPRAFGDKSVDSLSGLQGVEIYVAALTNNSKEVGLTEYALRVRVKQRLQQAGIRVLLREQAIKIPGRPLLTLNVTDVDVDPAGPSAGQNRGVTVVLELYQDVRLDRKQAFKMSAPTWFDSYTHIIRSPSANADYIRKGILADVDDVLDLFCKSYRKANPKK